MRSAGGDPHGDHMLVEEHNDIEFLCQDGRPLQLIKYDKRTGRFSVEPEAVQALLAVEGNVGFCALAGKYRTGKSFLLNQLLGLTGTGFRVNPSTTACTEGIWIWSKPIYNHTESLNIFFMDTEGLDSVDSNADHDSKIFALAMLLSSYFMFNSVGTIDESSINQLALVTHLVKNIAVSSDAQTASMYELSQFSPKFLWILRDFVLEVRDVRGNPATPAQYLESALCDVGHIRNLSEKSRKIREGIIEFFRERDCVTMVIPCLQEQDIKRLDTLPRERMRPEFLDQINVIRLKVYQQCGAKKLNGSYLNSRMYVKLAEEYVKAINQGSVPMIQNAWQGVLENECMGALENARKTYDTAFNEYFREQDRVYRKNDISSILKSLRDKAFTIFSVINSVKEGDEELFNTYMDELINHIERREKAVSERNAANCEAEDHRRFQACSKPLKEKLARGIYNTRNLSELENDYEVLLESYNRDSFGPNRNKVLCDSLKHLQVAMFQSLADSLGTEVSREVGAAERKIAELEIREKGFKMMNDTLENQIQMTRGDDEKFDREYKDLEDRNNEFIKTLSEANYAAQEYKATIKDLEGKKETKARDLTTIQLEIDELRKKKKGMCS